MKRFKSFRLFSKRQLFVLGVILLSSGIFVSEFITSGIYLILASLFLSCITSLIFYIATKEDLSIRFSFPVFILPFFYTLAFALFYPLVPARLLTRILLTSVYAFGLYSLFLTQNIFAVSAVRTINLLRSARIVSFVLTIVVMFLLTNIIFSQRLPIYFSSIIILVATFLLNFQSLWTYSLTKEKVEDKFILSSLIAVCIAELSLVLSVWPINAAIYSLFITGIFYAYCGLTHAWVERRLFKNVFWEYVWVGFLAVLILIFFSKWGI